MANKQTGIGLMFRRSQDDAVGELREVIDRCGGRITRMAEDLLISRRHLYRLLDRANLWEEVEAARKRARAPLDPETRQWTSS